MPKAKKKTRTIYYGHTLNVGKDGIAIINNDIEIRYIMPYIERAKLGLGLMSQFVEREQIEPSFEDEDSEVEYIS